MTIEELDNLNKNTAERLLNGCYPWCKEKVRLFAISRNTSSRKKPKIIVYYALCQNHGALIYGSFIEGKEVSIQDLFYLRIKYQL